MKKVSYRGVGCQLLLPNYNLISCIQTIVDASAQVLDRLRKRSKPLLPNPDELTTFLEQSLADDIKIPFSGMSLIPSSYLILKIHAQLKT